MLITIVKAVENEFMIILGISAFYHDSAAALLRDGEIIAAAQEERFTRKKQDADFPINAIQYCLKAANIQADQIDFISFYDKPWLKFERLLDTYLNYAPRGLRSFLMAIPVWLKEKIFLSTLIENELNKTFGLEKKRRVDWKNKLLYPEHHYSHAASAFYPSPFRNAAVLTVDGVGEWATTTIGKGDGNSLSLIKEIHFPHSLGLLYSAFTHYTGFKVNSGEYKVMGLAPYGEPKYVDTIYEHIIDLKADGSFTLNMDYFDYCTGLTMTNRKFDKLFGGPRRTPESNLTQKEMDLARSVQEVVEEAILRMARYAKEITGSDNLCMAGGVALNCVANGRILRSGLFKDIWIQPAAGDAGGALGAALAAWHLYLNKPREIIATKDSMKGSYLGPEYTESAIETFLTSKKIPYIKLSYDSLQNDVAELLKQEKVVGWFAGRMEFGPRALGARSIIGDARSQKMQSIMNLKIKYRESFRPFAPAVLRKNVSEYFEMDCDSPYMLLVAPVKEERCMQMSDMQKSNLWGIDLLNVPRSDIPAVTHVDYSARVQTVHKETNPKYYGLIEKFSEKTGCPVIVNTSFNVRGEPIVCTPEDAYRCFMRTEMDYLVLENFLIDKSQQQALNEMCDWREEFELD